MWWPPGLTFFAMCTSSHNLRIYLWSWPMCFGLHSSERPSPANKKKASPKILHAESKKEKNDWQNQLQKLNSSRLQRHSEVSSLTRTILQVLAGFRNVCSHSSYLFSISLTFALSFSLARWLCRVWDSLQASRRRSFTASASEEDYCGRAAVGPRRSPGLQQSVIAVCGISCSIVAAVLSLRLFPNFVCRGFYPFPILPYWPALASLSLCQHRSKAAQAPRVSILIWTQPTLTREAVTGKSSLLDSIIFPM